MNKIYYLEPDEEITKVIDRIRKSEESGVVFVVSRGSTIAQSIINLKLLSRNAAEHGKTIGIVSTDRVTKNLADRLKIPVFAKASEAEKAQLTPALLKAVEKPSLIDDTSVKVNTYKKYDLSKINSDGVAEGQREGEQQEIAEGAPEMDEEELEDDYLEDEDIEEEPIVREKSNRVAEGSFDRAQDRQKSREAEKPRKQISENRVQNVVEEAAIASDDFDDEEIDEEAAPSTTEEFHHSPLPVPELKKEEREENMRFDSTGNRRERSKAKRKFIAIASVVVILVAVILSYLFLPHAEATVLLKAADIDKKTTFTVDRNQAETDIGNLTVPGQLVELTKDQTKTFNSTGKKDSGTAATGTITITNTTSSKAVPVSPGAKVTASDGKVFTVKTGVMVPGAVISNPQLVDGKITYDTAPGTVDATVTASQNGESYNVASGTKFTVGTLSATAKAAFTGGSTKNIMFVTDDDLKNAQASMKTAVLADNKAELIANATTANLKIFEKNITAEIASMDANKNPNDESDTFQITAKIKLSTLGFSENILKAAMVKLVDTQLKSDEMLVNPDKSVTTYELSDYSADAGTMKLATEFRGKTGAKLSSDALIGQIKSKDKDTAKAYLEKLDGVVSASISSSPAFLGRLPIMANRIKITFDYEK